MNNQHYIWDIFICYASDNRDKIAVPIRNRFSDLKLKVWIDVEQIHGGDDYTKKIRKALNESIYIVAIFSADSKGKTYPIMEIGGVIFNPNNEREKLIPVFYDIPVDTDIKIDHIKNNHKLQINKDDPYFESRLNEIAEDINTKVKETKTEIKREKEKLTWRIVAFSIFLSLTISLIVYFLPNGDKIKFPKEEKIRETSITNNNKIKKPVSILPVVQIKNEKPIGININSQIQFTEKENYSSYLNSSIINSANNTEVSVTIIDNTNTIETSVSNAVANIYSKAGKTGNMGLIRNSFIKKPEFKELFEGNSDIIEKLKLNNYTDYLVLGKITYVFNPGSEVNGTIICNALLNVTVISTAPKSIVQSFSIPETGNDVSESKAQERALQKILNKYNSDYSIL